MSYNLVALRAIFQSGMSSKWNSNVEVNPFNTFHCHSLCIIFQTFSYTNIMFVFSVSVIFETDCS